MNNIEAKVAGMVINRRYGCTFVIEDYYEDYSTWTPDGFTIIHVYYMPNLCKYFVYAYAPTYYWFDEVTLSDLI